jgi:hypothetical protein
VHSRAGEGTVHGINSGHPREPFSRVGGQLKFESEFAIQTTAHNLPVIAHRRCGVQLLNKATPPGAGTPTLVVD